MPTTAGNVPAVAARFAPKALGIALTVYRRQDRGGGDCGDALAKLSQGIPARDALRQRFREFIELVVHGFVLS